VGVLCCLCGTQQASALFTDVGLFLSTVVEVAVLVAVVAVAFVIDGVGHGKSFTTGSLWTREFASFETYQIVMI
jgi:hypothetical protein